jgi:hypothetical protein
MERDAMSLMRECEAKGTDIYRYGADLPRMAEHELEWNIWGVRWLYLHILNGGLCLRPPHSMVEHIGFDASATNAADGGAWRNPPLQPCPPLPRVWPAPVENPECPGLWRKACGARSERENTGQRLMRIARGVGQAVARRVKQVSPWKWK